MIIVFKRKMLTVVCALFMFVRKTESLTTTLPFPTTFNKSTVEAHALLNTSELDQLSDSSDEASSRTSVRRLPCLYAPGLVPGNERRREICCAGTVRVYERRWASINQPLSRYLETLRGWNCPQFQEQCNRRLFAYNNFTTLLYDYFCNYNVFVEKCLDEVTKTVIVEASQETKSPQRINYTVFKENSSLAVLEWRSITSKLNESQLTMTQLLKPCIQVAQYDLKSAHYGEYQEINSLEVPSCDLVWCGFSGTTLKERIISVWTCMSQRCHVKIILIMVVCGMMSFAVTLVNLSVIIAIIKNPSLHSSQSTYKVSLAVADILVGAIVFPACISNLARLVWTPHVPEDFYRIEGYQLVNGTLSANTTFVEVRGLSGTLSTKFPRSYRYAIGFFTAISIFASVYSLAGAGFDRLNAVVWPLSYHKGKANKIAKWVCVISWILAVFFGALSFFVRTLPYGLILSILITNIGDNGIYLYTVSFLVPLVIVWILNIVTFRATQKHSKFRQNLTVLSQIKKQKRENRVARTLMLIVGVFTLNTLPLILLLICGFFIPNNITTRPRELDLNLHFNYLLAEFVAAILLLSNSFWNFFIYSARNRNFRLAVKKMYRNLSQTLGLSHRWGVFISYCRRMAHDGRRRISSLSNASTHSETNQKKKSSTTALSKATASPNFDNNTKYFPDVFSEPTPPQAIKSTATTSDPSLSNQKMESTSIDTSKSNNLKLKRKREKKLRDSSFAEEDSIFRSFEIDAHTSGFFHSVMRRVDKNVTIIPENAEN